MKIIIPLVLIALILFVTNPDKEAHIAKLKEHAEQQGTKEGGAIGGFLGGAVVGALGGAFERENYYLFSVLKSDEDDLTFGIAGQVFVTLDDSE